MQVFNFKTLYISIGQNFPKSTIFRSLQLKFHFYYKPFKICNDKYNGFGTPTDCSNFIIEKMEHAGIFQNIKVIENFLWRIFNIFCNNNYCLR